MDQIGQVRVLGTHGGPAFGGRWRRALALAALLCVPAGPGWAQPPGASVAGALSEYEIKAAFLLNFTKFIVWPPRTVSAESPFTICIVGVNRFGRALHELVEGETVDGRPIAVKQWPGPPAATCGILFVGRSERQPGALLEELPEGVLTVGERDDFLKQGGMIAFVVENRRVRFDVNVRKAAHGGLSLSSRLLNVARTVENQVRP